MTLPDLCPVCHGVHRVLACTGRAQTDREWMIDRGVDPARADEIIAARARHAAASGHVFPPMARPSEPRQEGLF